MQACWLKADEGRFAFEAVHVSIDVEQACVSAGFPGVNAEFQELVQACAEAALENNDSELQIKVASPLRNMPSSMRQRLPCLVLH